MLWPDSDCEHLSDLTESIAVCLGISHATHGTDEYVLID